MAPRVPEEIDVFTAPHSRMKELVHTYSHKMQCVDFRDVGAVICLLAELHAIVDEFKSHESIENFFIMEELRNRLKQRHIYNSAVCNCHNDNRLTEFFKLVCIGKEIPEESVGERLSFGIELQKAFTEFVNNFIPHMEEEEQVFQPLLVEHFEYAELKVLKEVVLEQHQLVKEQVTEKFLTDHPETKQEIKDLRDADHLDCSQLDSGISQMETDHLLEDEPFEVWEDTGEKIGDTINDVLCTEEAECEWNDTGENFKEFDIGVPEDSNENSIGWVYAEKKNSEEKNSEYVPLVLSNHHDIPAVSALNIVNEDEICKTPKLPPELLCKIFSYLTPPDLGHCAQVCWAWNAAVYSPALWKNLYPIQWARGIWQWENVELGNILESDAWSGRGEDYKKRDEDADVDETEQHIDTVSEKEHFILESLVTWVLPNVGSGVTSIILDAGTGVSSRLVNQTLILCPNIKHLSAAYTNLDYYAFKGLAAQWSLLHLKHLDLQGCDQVDDTVLECLAQCAEIQKPLQHNNEITKCPYFYPYYPTQDARSGPDVKCLDPGVVSSPVKSGGNMQVKGCHCIGMCQCSDIGGWCLVDGKYVCSRSACSTNSYGCPKLQINYSTRASLTFTNIPNNRLPNNDNYFNVCQQQQAPAYERDIEEICCAPHSYSSNHKALAAPQLVRAGIPLVHLNLSGCWRVTDEGLYALSDTGITEKLDFLDLSGLFQVSGECLEIVSETCSALQPKNLSYCDNIVDGPYKTEANCCANLNHPLRSCCRMGT